MKYKSIPTTHLLIAFFSNFSPSETKQAKYSFDSDEGSIKSDSDEEFVAVNNEVHEPRVVSSEDDMPVSKKWVKLWIRPQKIKNYKAN